VKDYAIYMLDATGHVQSWNSGAERIKGYSASEIIGKHFSVFYTEDDRIAERPQHNLHTAITEGRVEDEAVRIRKDGTQFFADVIITAVYWPDGTLRGFAKITRDVTERQQLSAARDEALRASKAKSAFLANMSHELRTPLNAILGYSELVEEELRENNHGQLADDVRKICSSSKHLLSIINDVLDLSRIESGQFQLDEEEVDIGELIRELADFFVPLAKMNRNQIVVDVAEDIVSMTADRTRLRQILYNLLSNGNKFTHDGQIRISAVRSETGKHLTITVKDTGIGITREDLDRIFERFYQVQTTPYRSVGTGLGLAISKLFCDAMGGTISVDSSMGEGSSFSLQLPYRNGVNQS